MTISTTSKPICPGYSSRESGSATPPEVRFDNNKLIVASLGQAVLDDPVPGQCVGTWMLMAVFLRGTDPVAVFEQIDTQEGDIAFVGASGVMRMSGKSLEPTSEGEAGLQANKVASWYRGHAKEDVMPDHRDVMRDELLANGRDPDFEDVAGCYPPVRQAFFEGHLRPHSFVGTAISNDVVPLFYEDVTMVSRVPIGVVAPGSEKAMAAGDLWEGLVGGWTPLVRTVYPIGPEDCWEVITFASSPTANDFKQPVWYRFVHLKAGKVVETRYVDSFLPHPHEGKDIRERFYAELFETLAYWDREIDGGMVVTGWDWLDKRSHHAFAREMITRHGAHPKYGIADQAYAGAEHDGFQDVLVSSVLGCLEWGYFTRARAYLDDYFTHFVRSDGTLHYRGPEMGKYGVSLTCIGLYTAYTGDGSLLVAHREKIDAIADMLLGRWRRARECAPNDPAYGMIPGYHEADINFLTPNVYELGYDRPYLSNTGEAWRGLRDIAAAYSALAETSSDANLAQRGSDLAAAAAEIFKDARNGVDRSWIVKNGVEGLPIIAGDKTFYWEHAYRARPESYDENRVWSELYFGGATSEKSVRRIWEIAGERGHTTLGVFNNRKSLVGFLVWEEIAGLIQNDMIPEALLVFYAQAIHAHTRGTWTAIECVDMDRARGAHSPYCLPSQMTVPIAAKWLLVYEEPVSGIITLGRGIPRTCLAHGKTIGVTNAPSRRGKIGFSLISRIEDGEISASVSLPMRPGAPIRLRIRAPEPFVLQSATATSHEGMNLGIDKDCVCLPEGLTGEIRIKTQWRRETVV